MDVIGGMFWRIRDRRGLEGAVYLVMISFFEVPDQFRGMWRWFWIGRDVVGDEVGGGR